jgi:hypothetical protein
VKQYVVTVRVVSYPELDELLDIESPILGDYGLDSIRMWLKEIGSGIESCDIPLGEPEWEEDEEDEILP